MANTREERDNEIRVGLVTALVSKGIPVEDAARIAAVVASSLEEDRRIQALDPATRRRRARARLLVRMSKFLAFAASALAGVLVALTANQLATSGFVVAGVVIGAAISSTAVLAVVRAASTVTTKRASGRAGIHVAVRVKQADEDLWSKDDFPDKDVDQFADAVGRLVERRGSHFVG